LILMAAALLAVVLGVPLGLYALMTRGQRRTIREICVRAREQGWEYGLRRWQGNPAAFRIEGRTRSGLAWIMTTENASDTQRRWAVDLRLRFPTLGGEPDLTIQPRACEDLGPLPADAREQPAGHPAFDAAYQVMASPRWIARPPIDSGFAGRLLHWPADAVQPRALLAWRDRDAFQFHAGLPAPPNWATVSHLAALAEELTARLPAPVQPP
jgi:hypothetical protein